MHRLQATPARELVTRYCVTCHNEKLKTANLLLDKADAEHVFNSAETWEKVVVQLRAARCRLLAAGGRTMPHTTRRPHGSRPSSIARPRHVPNPGRPADLHRLNRTEYANAVRDLLGVEIDGTLMLPPDEQAHGFDTNADALSVVPALLDRYLTAAAKISRLALGDPDASAGVRALYRRQEQLRATARGCGRPSDSAKSSRWARAAESQRVTTSRSMASMC